LGACVNEIIGIKSTQYSGAKTNLSGLSAKGLESSRDKVEIFDLVSPASPTIQKLRGINDETSAGTSDRPEK
jgi:hypothetical protein